jgi:acyl-CoA thioester hydrolase
LGTALDYKWHFTVRRYETGADGVPYPAAYVRYLEEGAIQASAHHGFTSEWYLQHGHFWIIRRLALRFYQPAFPDDELELHTWISSLRRVASHREYDLRRLSDGARIVRARHDWIYVNAATMRPATIPPEIALNFEPLTSIEELDIGIADPQPIQAPRIYESTRRVMRSDLDLAQHVNNAVHLGWCDDHVIEALRDVGFAPDTPIAPGVTQHRLAHEVDYLRPVKDHDSLILKTSLAEYGADRAAFMTTIHHAETGELLATDRLTFAYTDPHGPCPVPPALLTAMAAQQEITNG